MPEIIEAEITKRKLSSVRGKIISDLWIDGINNFISEENSLRKTKNSLIGRRIQSIERKGKAVVFELDRGKILGIHPRMSGAIMLDGTKTSKAHTRFRLRLDKDKELVLVDPRRFGIIWYGSQNWFQKQGYVKKLGTDALRVSEEEFISLGSASTASLKSFLLQQEKIAGVGNIVCDETLWNAQLNPVRKMNKLTTRELSGLYKALNSTLSDMLQHEGTSVSDWMHPDGNKGTYQDNFKIYSKKECTRCGTPVKRITLAGRGTHFCTKCQR